jgi:hypothetical protein
MGRQQRVWLAGGEAADIDFTDTVEDFFMITEDDASGRSMTGLNDVLCAFEEAVAIDEVRSILDLVLDEAGAGDERVADVLSHRRWPDVVASARQALEVMRRFDALRLEPGGS